MIPLRNGFGIINIPFKHRGVAIVLRSHLYDRIVSRWYSQSGRGIGILLQLDKNVYLMVVSIYSPTNLDRSAVDGPWCGGHRSLQ